MLCCFALLALFATIQGRAVNISNTWVLPEEGFPVFYRYFRDRISWYEADAVCQFHHANLVTVDTTAQYDAVRAYLKELDISTAVWVGLIRSNPEGEFSWTDFHGLTGDGYWSSAPDSSLTPLCAAADPAADYRWQARPCGGPSVASFICELPVPQWALGAEGCMVQELPALTVLYLPESAAVQLTADCGLAEAKRVQCTGNVKRAELLKDLSCIPEEDITMLPNISSNYTENSLSEISTLEINETTSNDFTTISVEENITTPKEQTEKLNIPTTAEIPNSIITQDTYKKEPYISGVHKIYLEKNINLDILHNNNLQSNDIPKLADDEMLLKNEQMQKLEDEKHIQQKLLHDELANGNFDTVYSQQTDHFVPPLVMAKARVSDDMTVLSLAEKHAQQLVEHQNKLNSIKNYRYQYFEDIKQDSDLEKNNDKQIIKSSDKHLLTLSKPKQYFKEKAKKEKNKNGLPKKYNGKYEDQNSKITKPNEYIQVTTNFSDSYVSATTVIPKTSKVIQNITEDDPSIDITVVLKEPEDKLNVSLPNSVTDSSPVSTTTSYDADKPSTTTSQVLLSGALSNITFTHDVVKVTLVPDVEDKNLTDTVFEVTTKIPVFDSITSIENITSLEDAHASTETKSPIITLTEKPISTNIEPTSMPSQKGSKSFIKDVAITTFKSVLDSTGVNISIPALPVNIETITSFIPKISTAASTEETTYKAEEVMTQSTIQLHTHSSESSTLEKNSFDVTESESIDYSNSPLLSGASEPIHKPNRRSRQKSQNPTKKFKPFLVLG